MRASVVSLANAPVAARTDQQQFVVEHAFHFDMQIGTGAIEQAEIDLPLVQPVENVAGVPLDQ